MKKNIFITILIIIVVISTFAIVRLLNIPGEKPINVTPKEISTAATELKQQKNIDIISWKNATLYYGKYKTVEGRIVDTHNSGKACFLNFHPNWKIYFTAVIFRSDFHKFPDKPEEYYFGKKVRVSGYIKKYQGKPEIILKYPSQIEILE